MIRNMSLVSATRGLALDRGSMRGEMERTDCLIAELVRKLLSSIFENPRVSKHMSNYRME